MQRGKATSIGRVQTEIVRPGAKVDRLAAGHGDVPSERQLTRDGARSALECSRVACVAQPGPPEREDGTQQHQSDQELNQ